MKREPFKTLCHSRERKCRELRLTELRLKAESDRDVEILEMLNALFELDAGDPERVAAVRKNLELMRQAQLAARNN